MPACAAPAGQPASAIAARRRRHRFSQPTFQLSISLAITPTSGALEACGRNQTAATAKLSAYPFHLLHPLSCNSFVYTDNVTPM